MSHRLGLSKRAGLVAALWALVGCGLSDPQTSRLRITNAGDTAIVNLTVLFPEDQIRFGDVPAGATSQYEEVPNGVYTYAAYSLEIDGALVTQPVTDWVGELPMEGRAFTYTLVVDPQGPLFGIVQLRSVTVDE